ncbi:DUF84 family protein [Planomicrobium okeanokoites]|uniref:inosine/xanthosine triphosphatase n=1 Tax=Planomicrobium okeanokoites TaxID=244 RepID=A0ABV7KR83_PLAOK|nr:DUF84 family protein [Planomicrobium okeanokoites]TAA70757.1 DUF84 family protein [Planomicrobium okeanokoites]
MKKMSIAVASKNPAKISAVEDCLAELAVPCEITAVETDSAVSAQPFSIKETRQGAVNRAVSAIEGGYDFAVGLEGGVYELDGTMYVCNWGALATSTGKLYTAGGAQIPLPEEIAVEVRNGQELGPVMDAYANEAGIRQYKGAIGILTDGLIHRGEMFAHIVKMLIGQYRLGSG